MSVILETLSAGLDWLFEALVAPVFITLGQGLELLLLRPLALLNMPVAMQTVIIAFLTACLSMAIRALIRVEKHEAVFRRQFEAKRLRQQHIGLLPDWKTRDAMYRTTDNDIDEVFNTYLAQRFARHSGVYLLPLFFSLFWLDYALPVEKIEQLSGTTFALALPANSYGIEGLSVPFIFLAAYAGSLICLFQIKKRLPTPRPVQSPSS